MKKFTRFITEAKISESSLVKVMKVYQKLLTKHAGSEVVMYGRGSFPAPIMGGSEYILCSMKRHAWGFNYMNGEIHSISVWKKGKFQTHINGFKDPTFSPADFTIDVTDVNLMKVGEFLKELLVKPKVGKFSIQDGKLVKEDFAQYVEDEFISEAAVKKQKLRNQTDFWRIVAQYARPLRYDPSRMTQDDLDALEVEANIFIPVYVNKYGKGKAPKSGRGANATWDLTVFDPSNVNYIDVKGGDAIGGRQHPGVFRPEVKKAESTVRTWRERIEDPGPEDINVYKTDPDSLFAQLEKRVIKLIKSVHTFFVVGGPGIGKTYVVSQKLRELGYKELNMDNIQDDTDTSNPKYYPVMTGSISLFRMIQTVFKHSKPGQIVMFDDADTFMDAPGASDVLKAMLGSGDARWVTIDKKMPELVDLSPLSPDGQVTAQEMLYNINNGKFHLYEPEDLNVGGEPIFSTKDGSFTGKWRGGVDLVTKGGKPKVPNKFKYEGKMAFISNRTYDKIDSAVRSRINNMLDMTLTPSEVAFRMRSLMRKGVLGARDVPMNIKEEILDVLIAYMDDKTMKPEDLNMRTFLACETEWITFPDMDLKGELKFTLQPNYEEFLKKR